MSDISCSLRSGFAAATGDSFIAIRTAGLLEYRLVTHADSGALPEWRKADDRRDGVGLSAGCYMLGTNVTDWRPDELWRAYVQLSQAEDAFRIHKTDLKKRPIWHQRSDCVHALIRDCRLTFVLWMTLRQMAHAAGPGDEPGLRHAIKAWSSSRLSEDWQPHRQHVARPGRRNAGRA